MMKILFWTAIILIILALLPFSGLLPMAALLLVLCLLRMLIEFLAYIVRLYGLKGHGLFGTDLAPGERLPILKEVVAETWKADRIAATEKDSRLLEQQLIEAGIIPRRMQ